MEITNKLLLNLQNRLKVGNRRGVHLNAIPGRSRYKFDVTRLAHIDENLPQNFIDSLLSKLPLKFKISWKNNVPDLNSLFEEDQTQLVKLTKSFENLINQTAAIESEKGINTFGFGFPLLVRKDLSDNKLTVAFCDIMMAKAFSVFYKPQYLFKNSIRHTSECLIFSN